jgi:hypothetical protein
VVLQTDRSFVINWSSGPLLLLYVGILGILAPPASVGVGARGRANTLLRRAAMPKSACLPASQLPAMVLGCGFSPREPAQFCHRVQSRAQLMFMHVACSNICSRMHMKSTAVRRPCADHKVSRAGSQCR